MSLLTIYYGTARCGSYPRPPGHPAANFVGVLLIFGSPIFHWQRRIALPLKDCFRSPRRREWYSYSEQHSLPAGVFDRRSEIPAEHECGADREQHCFDTS
jgi:hypothetical protein